ncbi:MAG TPA: MaoC family dehydratase, partial [Blastocatellia bacterium]
MAKENIYRVRARNTATESENKIHDDDVAARFGFKGGLVPGVVVYGYMTVPVVERFGAGWFERGRMEVKFLQPFYEGDLVVVRAEVDDKRKIRVTAQREDGEVCAAAVAALDEIDSRSAKPCLEDYPEAPLPDIEARPVARFETLTPGLLLGSMTEKLNLPDETLLDNLHERLTIYSGPETVAHPTFTLSLANQLLVRNFRLGPWIHASSEIINWSAARDGETISVRGRIVNAFERKGHEFVCLDVLLLAGERLSQQIRHTA